jgi:sugar/nucleoside kinase (ribokinase family)
MSCVPRPRGSFRFDVTLVGDINLDILLYGLPDDLALERELLANRMAMHVGGSAAITAHNMAAMHNSVGLVAMAPHDEFGTLCQKELQRAGVDLSRCVAGTEVQTGVTVLLQHQRYRRMLTYPGATAQMTYESLDLEYLTDARHFHMCSYYLQRALTPSMPLLFSTLKQAGMTISLDPNDDPNHSWDRNILQSLRHVDILMPNEREACLLAAEPELDRAISFLTGLVPILVIKRGADGASVHCGSRAWYVSARNVKVVDAVGAGDSFNAGFLHGWLRGMAVEEALAFGNLTGAWSTMASGGTSSFSGDQQIAALDDVWANESQNLSKQTVKPVSFERPMREQGPEICETREGYTLKGGGGSKSGAKSM